MKIGLTFDLKVTQRPEGAAEDWDEEFDHPSTIDALDTALEGLGHTVVRLGDGPECVRLLLENRPEFVFNLAEGLGEGRSRDLLHSGEGLVVRKVARLCLRDPQ